MAEETEQIDTQNKFMVGINGNDIVIMRLAQARLSQADALNLAAWLVALADHGDRFDKLLQAVENA